MLIRLTPLFVLVCMLACGCSSVKQAKPNHLAKWLTGDFSTKPSKGYLTAQAHIRPIWEGGLYAKSSQKKDQSVWAQDKKTRWLYVEQSVTEGNFDNEPYRQRVYKLTQQDKQTVACNIFMLPEPLSKWQGGYINPLIFNEISPKDLLMSDGCTILFTLRAGKTFIGKMNPNECLNTLWEAKYVKSEGIQVQEKSFTVSDKGVDEKNRIKWGKGRYTFVKERKGD